jgi:hypothetical protein
MQASEQLFTQTTCITAYALYYYKQVIIYAALT